MKVVMEIKPLGDLCDFERGLTYSKGDEVQFSKNVVLRANNIDLATNKLDFSELKYIRESFSVSLDKKVKKGSLIICTASGSKKHLGKVAYIDENYDFAFGGFMGMITPKNGLNPNYLFYLMISRAYNDFIAGLSDGANINNLKFENLKDFGVPLVSDTEQHRIVSILDKAFEGIATAKANTEKNLQNARELFDSYLGSVFSKLGKGWKQIRFDDQEFIRIIDGDRGRNYPKANEFHDEGHCLFLNTKNVRMDGFNFDSTMFITEGKDNKLGKGKLERNDVVLTTRGTIGNVGLYHEDVPFENIRINSGMLILRPNQRRILPSFLFMLLRSSIIIEQIKRHTSGAAQPQLPIRTLVNFTMPVPTALETQLAIVNNMNGLEKETKALGLAYSRKIESLEELRSSILHQAFSGQL